MKRLIGVFVLSVAIPVLHAGNYNFSTLHQGTGSSSVGHDSSLGDRHPGTGNGPILVGGDTHPPGVVATPEPGFYGLMALGFSALVIFQVRKRRQA